MDFSPYFRGSGRRGPPLASLVNVLWFFGGAMVLAGAGIGGYRLLSAMESEEVTARVVDVRHNRWGEAAPIVAYEVEGEHHEHQSEEFSDADFAIGDELKVRYSADDPGDARIVDFLGTWGQPLWLAGIGGFFLITGLVMVRRRVPGLIRRGDQAANS